MKIFLLMFAAMLSVLTAKAQLKTTAICPPFDVDILEGTVNQLFPYSGIADVEKKFPCFTTTTPETNGATCGGVFFNDKDLYFFTERDYIEIRQNFKGKLSLPILGAKRNALFTWLGNPTIKDVSYDAYQTKYGILIIYFNASGIITKFQMTNKNQETIKLCE
ncbi:MAG: hypothetical protein JWP81_552 [Ferruginibacter sp.]|nr:hypothetical protein [Ferruginibacter sp.]